MKYTQYLAVVREYKVGFFYENCFYNIDEAIDFASEIADCINQYGRGDDNPEMYEDVNMSIYKLMFESELDIPSPRDLYLYKRFIVHNGALRLVDDNEVIGIFSLITLRLYGLTSIQEKLLAHLQKSSSISGAMNGCH